MAAAEVDVTAILTVEGVGIAFGGLQAVQDFGLELRLGGLQGLIGPNGAGKTTVFNLLTGVYRPDTGTIRLGDVDLVGKRPHQIACAGMARTFQNIRLFPNLSVLDNVRLACHPRSWTNLLAALLSTPSALAEEAAITAQAHDLLEIFGLEGRADETARNLPYGDQRRLEIARALALDPKVLLLDEPAAGMNPQEKRELAGLIHDVRDRFDLSVLLIEHDMELVMGLCERISVLDHGVVISEGPPERVQRDPKVIEAYLGAPAAAAEG